jgi:hypothetical protein
MFPSFSTFVRTPNLNHCHKPQNPDGFTAHFLQTTWHIIWANLMLALDAIGRLDTRSFHDLNQALMVLLPNTSEAATVKDLTHLLDPLLWEVGVQNLGQQVSTKTIPISPS